MKFVVAIDSYKGSLSSIEAGNAAKEGILKAVPKAEVIVMPLADGGEGTVDTLAEGLNGEIACANVTGPMGGEIASKYCLIENGSTAVMEMASASGLTLVPKDKLNPLVATSYGVGQMLAHAINKGCRDFIVGIGGSATNDGGVGMLQALGFQFLDGRGKEIGFGGGELDKIETIKTDSKNPLLDKCTFKIACDVNNPLCGEVGASAIYGPQKGATKQMIDILDKNLNHFAQVTKKTLAIDCQNTPGAGAAGGLGYGFMAYLKGELSPGIEIVLDIIKIDNVLEGTDVLITGEGRVDAQTAMGKAPVGVAKRGKKYGAKTIALAGCTTLDSGKCNQQGLDGIFSIANGAMSLEEAMDKDIAAKNLTFTAEQIVRIIL